MNLETKEEYLNPQWRKFLDEYFSNGFKGTKAYLKVYPKVGSRTSAEAAASRLLKNVKVRGEINIRFNAQGATEAWVFSRLMEIAEYHDAYRINAAVRALTIIARAKGMLSIEKKPVFTGENPAIFLPIYSEKEREKFEVMAQAGRVFG